MHTQTTPNKNIHCIIWNLDWIGVNSCVSSNDSDGNIQQVHGTYPYRSAIAANDDVIIAYPNGIT